MKSTTTWLFGLLLGSLFLTACDDPNYNGEHYQAFDSMDALTQQMLESFKTQNPDLLLTMLDNQVLLLDLLAAASSDKAQQIKAHSQSPLGQRKLSSERLAQKQRVYAFFDNGLHQQLADNAASLRSTGVELIYQQPYEEDSPAQMQSYTLRMSDDTGQVYTYDFQVILWNGFYHLIEVSGFLNLG
jgi:hypothetical protein